MKKYLLNSNAAEQPVSAEKIKDPLLIIDKPEEIVIYDECGDTLWDKVLAQESPADKLEQ